MSLRGILEVKLSAHRLLWFVVAVLLLLLLLRIIKRNRLLRRQWRRHPGGRLYDHGPPEARALRQAVGGRWQLAFGPEKGQAKAIANKQKREPAADRKRRKSYCWFCLKRIFCSPVLWLITHDHRWLIYLYAQEWWCISRIFFSWCPPLLTFML